MVTGLFRLALLLAAMCFASGCRNNDVGPDPQPWTPFTAAPAAPPR